MNDEFYTIEIFTEDNPPSLIDELKSLPTVKMKHEPDPIMITDVGNKSKENINKKSKKKKKKKSLLLESFDDLNMISDKDEQEIEEETLLDVDTILMNRVESDEDDDSLNIVNEQKKGYKKLKKDDNTYKKEFAEEITLLYTLLDETSKFGKELEKDLASLRGSKTRGISKYTNDLAELVLQAKQNKLNILKEITSTKKTIADLKIKAEGKSKDNENSNAPEYLASAYFKNILAHGRTNFINTINSGSYQSDNDEDDYESVIERIEQGNRYGFSPSEDEQERYNELIMNRIENTENPYRSEAGTKYIEYENAGVKLYVKKCIDTGEWEFIALDKTHRQIYDYPLPSKRDAGRMKFSDDGTYATDAKGRIYNVIEYFLPDNSDEY